MIAAQQGHNSGKIPASAVAHHSNLTGIGTNAASILLPMRLALFLTSLVVLSFIGQALWSMLINASSQTELIKAGLFGLTTFIISIMANVLELPS